MSHTLDDLSPARKVTPYKMRSRQRDLDLLQLMFLPRECRSTFSICMPLFITFVNCFAFPGSLIKSVLISSDLILNICVRCFGASSFPASLAFSALNTIHLIRQTVCLPDSLDLAPAY